ncbi:MAG: calmodulin [Tabrizicola sp.]|nr:calmodulin [Tabrizicola sp.]
MAGATEADTFVIALNNPATIAEARAIASGQQQLKVHVTGLVVDGAVPYNAPWSFHLHPASISFFEMSIEVCDAATTYVEEYLAEVGGAFLPGRRWCPWSSRVIAEID